MINQDEVDLMQAFLSQYEPVLDASDPDVYGAFEGSATFAMFSLHSACSDLFYAIGWKMPVVFYIGLVIIWAVT